MLDEDLVEVLFAEHDGDLADPGVQEALWSRLAEHLDGDTPFETHWALYQRCFGKRSDDAAPPIVWRPAATAAAATNIGTAMAELGHADYAAFHRWSAQQREAFWADAVERVGIRFDRDPEKSLDASAGPEDARWFPGATLNIVASCFNAAPDAVAIVAGREGSDDIETVTVGDLRRRVDQAAAGLRAAGFVEGDAIALYMPMNTACVVAYLGIIQAGCVAVSIADSFAPNEVRSRLEIADAKAIVTVDAFHRGGRSFRLYEKAVEAGARRAIVVRGDDADVVVRAEDVDWDDLLERGAARIVVESAAMAASIGSPERTTNILFSSGTTGDPKAIPWTHLTPIKCAVDAHYHQDVRHGDVVAWPTNIGWMMGPWLIYAALINRATIALFEGAPNSDAFCRFVERAKVTMLGVVPALVRAWRVAAATDNADWSGIRCFSSTGEASNSEDYLWLMSQAGYQAPVIEYCGGTEVGGGHITGTMVQPAALATFTTAALGLDLVVLGEDDSPVEIGHTGTLYLVPPSVGLSERLLNRDHHEEYFGGCPDGPGGEVLRRHGDAVARLPGGFWQAHGRADDTMNLGGIKVSSLELERVMDAHPSVYRSAAVAIPPAGGGADALVVFVVPTPDGTSPEPAGLKKSLQTMVGSELNPLFRIHEVVVTESLPRTASNKIMRRALRQSYLEGQTAAS